MFVLQQLVAILSLLGVGALFGGSLYDAAVLAPNLRNGAAGLEHGRLFLARATPANLFRWLSPGSQLLLLIALAANWARPECRWLLLGAFAALLASDLLTFSYHYPRNRLFFTAPLTVDAKKLERAARQWAAANLLRVALVLGAWIATLAALLRLVLQGQPWPAV